MEANPERLVLADSTYSHRVPDSRRWIAWMAVLGMALPKALPGHDLPLAVTSGFSASRETEWPLFGDELEGGNFRTWP